MRRRRVEHDAVAIDERNELGDVADDEAMELVAEYGSSASASGTSWMSRPSCRLRGGGANATIGSWSDARISSGASCRASASGRSSTASRCRHELGGFVLNDGDGCRDRGRGRRGGARAVRARARATEAPELARVDVVERARASSRAARPGSGSRSARARGGTALDPARRRHLRRLPARALRSRRSPLPLPVHQLHAVRAALHDRDGRAVRPAAHDDGRLPAVRRLPARVRGSGGPPLPRRADRVPGLRPAALAAARRGRSLLLRAGAILAVKGLGGYHLACDAANEDAVARLRARKHREDKPFAVMTAEPERLAELSDGERLLLESRERPIVLVARAARGGRPGRRASPSRPGTPWLGRDAAVHPAAPPAARRLRRRARDDERQPLRRADRVRRRRGPRAARRDRRRVPRARPADPPPLRGLGRARGLPDPPLARLRAGRAPLPVRGAADRSSRSARS